MKECNQNHSFRLFGPILAKGEHLERYKHL